MTGDDDSGGHGSDRFRDWGDVTGALPKRPVATPAAADAASPYATGSQPTQPYAQPVQPYAQPVQPYAQPVQPYAQPTQSYDPRPQPAQPYDQPTQSYDPRPQPAQPYDPRPQPAQRYDPRPQPAPRYDQPGAPQPQQSGRLGSQQHADQATAPGPWPTRISGPRALGAVAVVILVAAVAVVSLPRLLAGNADGGVYDGTRLVRPATVAGLPRVADAKVTAEDKRAAQQLLSAVRTPLTTTTTVYGRATGVRLTVVAGRPAKPLSGDDRASLRDGFTSGMDAAGAPVHALDPGRLGGWLGCGQAPGGRQTLCLALDAGAVLSITVAGPQQNATTLAQEARRAVELRTGG